MAADFAKSARSKRRKVKALAEEHLRDVTTVTAVEGHLSGGDDGDDVHGMVFEDIASASNAPGMDCQVVGSATNCFASNANASDSFAINEDLGDGDFSDVTISDTASSNDDCNSIIKQLAQWATKFNISQLALSALLQILRNADVDVPKDARTVMCTPKTVDIANVAGGSYFYFGIGPSIRTRMNCSGELLTGSELNVHINIDGLPLSRSSSVQLWPILGTIQEIKFCEPFVIAVYSACRKPNSVHEYMKDFISEMKDLQQNGFTVNGKLYSVKLTAVICDAPARAFVKCIKGHSGYNSCERCVQEGDYCDNKMTFPEMEAPLRTDEQFASWTDKDHQPELSPLVSLGLGCVSQFPLDYMHLVCLGVVRRMIFFWIQGPLKHRLGSVVVSHISEHLLSLRNDIPTEFSRKPRSLLEVRNWKATEFRQFLLYTGPVVLAGKLPKCMYHCFMLLSVALTILLSEELCESHCDYAEQLLTAFVKNFASLYGQGALVYNVHNLLHLAQDARRYGALDSVSSFPFENYLGKLKTLARKPSRHVSQIVRRIAEREHAHQSSVFELDNPGKPHKKPHTSGPVPVKFANCHQFKQFVKPGCYISSNLADNCFELSDKTVLIRNILTTPADETLVVYEDFEHSESLFSYPLQSANIGIKLVHNLSGRLSVTNISDIRHKCVLFQHRSGFVAVPLLHLH